jgi:hypothetical protein
MIKAWSICGLLENIFELSKPLPTQSLTHLDGFEQLKI